MSSKTMSPTATLLRNSRLFSLPPPLPRPLNDLMGHVQSNRVSDTATLPYPIQQAIATTPSALGRGDWGLKRALPLRSTTNTSTPLYRINAVDTREHITDFESASDLTLTLEKFQELNLPVTAQPSKERASMPEPRLSAFDSTLDNTDPRTPPVNASGKRNHRWKFHGPWTAGMNQGDFAAYLDKVVSRRRPEFLEMLKLDCLQKLRNTERQKARAEGEDPEEPIEDAQLSEEDFAKYMKDLRSNSLVLGSPLAKMIADFLDLPPLPTLNQPPTPYHKEEGNDGDQGPPRTHPSAGLSYLQSDAFLENDPLLGPLAQHTPVEARVLHGVTADRRGKVGVAGIAANGAHYDNLRSPRVSSIPKPVTEGMSASEQANSGRENAGTTIGINIEGGSRIWIQPIGVGINARGRIDLDVANADRKAVSVRTGEVLEDATPTIGRKVIPQMQRLDSVPLTQDQPYGSGGNGPPQGANKGVSDVLDWAEAMGGKRDRSR